MWVPIMLLCVSFLLFALVWVLYVRKRRRGAQCNACTSGVVVGPSAIHYAGHHIPLVSYEVDGRTYRVAGPKFEGGTSTPSSVFNVTDRERPPARLIAPPVTTTGAHLSNEILYARSPLSRLYPVGCSLPVWYDPHNPKVAYVLRPVREGVVALRVLLPLALCLVVAAVAALCVR